MKLLFTTILALIVLAGMAQERGKWHRAGWYINQQSWYGDSVMINYALKGKDSISFKIEEADCGCAFYLEIGDHKKIPCKNMKRHYMETAFWEWIMPVTVVKGVVTKTGKQHWETHSGEMSTVDGTYTIGNKEVYPAKLFYKSGKSLLINNY